MIAIFWFRATPGLKDDLDSLRDGAVLLVILALILSGIELRMTRRRTGT